MFHDGEFDIVREGLEGERFWGVMLVLQYAFGKKRRLTRDSFCWLICRNCLILFIGLLVRSVVSSNGCSMDVNKSR